MAHHFITLPVRPQPPPGPWSIKQGKIAGGNKQKRARLEPFDKWQKAPATARGRRRVDRPTVPSVAPPVFFFMPPCRALCHSVTFLVTLSALPTPPYYPLHTDGWPPSLRASQRCRRAAEQNEQAGRGSADGWRDKQPELSTLMVESKRKTRSKTKNGVKPFRSERLPFCLFCLCSGP